MRIDSGSCCDRIADWRRDHEVSTTRERERLLLASATQQTDASLRVVTDDGDVVTLSSHQESSVTYADYRRSVRSPEGSERQRIQVFEASSEQSFSIEIEGTLDEEERADLEALIQRVAAGFRRFEQGDDAGAQAILAGGESLDSLESFAVHFEREQTVTVAELMRRTQSMGEPVERAAQTPTQPTVAPLPVAPVASEPAAQGWHAHAHNRHGGRAQRLERAAQVVDQLVEQLASRSRAFDVEKAVGALRAALVQPAPGQPAPVSLPVTEAPISLTDTA